MPLLKATGFNKTVLIFRSSHGLDVIEKDHTVDKGPKLEAAKVTKL